MPEDKRTPEQMHFAAYLEKRMSDRSKSINQLHTDTGVSRNAISDALKGESNPRRNTVGRLIKALDGERDNGDPDIRPFHNFVREQEKKVVEEQNTVDEKATDAPPKTRDEDTVIVDETGAPNCGALDDQQNVSIENSIDDLTQNSKEVGVFEKNAASILKPDDQTPSDENSATIDDGALIIANDVGVGKAPQKTIPKSVRSRLLIATLITTVSAATFLSQFEKSDPGLESDKVADIDSITVNGEPHVTKTSDDISSKKTTDVGIERESVTPETDKIGLQASATSLYSKTGLKFEESDEKRIMVAEVNEESEAYKKGVSAGDLLDKIDNVKIENLAHLYQTFNERINSKSDYLPLTFLRERRPSEQKTQEIIIKNFSQYDGISEKEKLDLIRYDASVIVVWISEEIGQNDSETGDSSTQYPQWSSLKLLETKNIKRGQKEKLRSFGAQFKNPANIGFSRNPKIKPMKASDAARLSNRADIYELLTFDRSDGRFLKSVDYTKLVNYLSKNLGYSSTSIDRINFYPIENRYILSIYDDDFTRYRLIALSTNSEILWITDEFRGQHVTLVTKSGIITGYGSGSSKDYVSILDIYTGNETHKELVVSQPSYMELNANQLIVQTYVKAYKFEVK